MPGCDKVPYHCSKSTSLVSTLHAVREQLGKYQAERSRTDGRKDRESCMETGCAQVGNFSDVPYNHAAILARVWIKTHNILLTEKVLPIFFQ